MNESPVIYSEYRDQHRHRMYPFLDDASLTSQDGRALANDFLIDAFLYPLNIVGSVYIQRLDLVGHKLYFADSATGIVCGVAELGSVDDAVPVYEDGGFQRQVGLIIYGAGVASLPSGADLTFEFDATTLTPTAFVPLNQEGVRGLTMPEGMLYTGAITLDGRDGVSTYTYIDGTGRNILQINAPGVPPAPQDACTNVGPTIREIVLEVEPESPITVTQYSSGIIAITTRNLDLDELCPAKAIPDDAGNMPGTGSAGPCSPPAPPAPPAPPPEPPPPFQLVSVLVSRGRLDFIAPSALGYNNPISIKAEYSPVGGEAYRAPLSPRQGNLNPDAYQQVTDALRPKGTLKLSLLAGGIASGRKT